MRDVHTQYPQKENVWARILNNQIVGPFFISGNFNGKKYLDLLNNIPIIHHNIAQGAFDNVWFQQDGAQAHYALIVRNLLNNTSFSKWWIGQRSVVEWSPR